MLEALWSRGTVYALFCCPEQMGYPCNSLSYGYEYSDWHVPMCRGGMIFTFYKARGMGVGSSLVEDDKLDLAKKLEQAAKDKGVQFILPTDVIAADKFDENANTKVVAAGEIPEGWMVCLCLHCS